MSKTIQIRDVPDDVHAAVRAEAAAAGESLGCPLLTTDGEPSRASGHHVDVEVYQER